MDQIKVGAFIADLRRGRGLTQEQLGERIGATNKTVSRWETGIYMPPIEALEALSKEFGVTINELIAGEQLFTEEKFLQKAEENLLSVCEDSSFTLKEKQGYFKRRWKSRHFTVTLLTAVVLLVLIFVGIFYSMPWLVYVSCAAGFLLNIYRYNAMMAYVERKAFEKPHSEMKTQK